MVAPLLERVAEELVARVDRHHHGRRQQEVLRALFSQALQAGTLTRIPELYNNLRSTVETDLGLGDILQLALYAPKMTNADIRSYYIRPPYVSSWITDGGAYVLLPNEDALQAMLTEAMSDHRSDERVVVGGTANLARFGDSFEQSIKPMLEALEEHVVLLKLLGEATSPSTVTVRIGHEGPYQELATTSVVATGYGPGEEALAALGIVGPTRMDYPGTMAAVRAVARYVSRILDEG